MTRSKVLTALLALAVLGAGAWFWLAGTEEELPAGIARGNGRIEAERIDVATKFGGRVQEILVSEGDLVEEGRLLALMDAAQAEAQLREAKAAVRQAEESLKEAKALLAQRQSELRFAEQELKRAEHLEARGHATPETVDRRRMEYETAEARVASAEAGIARAEATIDSAEATVARIEADLAEFRLLAPRDGRVQYRLAEPGEVLSAGARVVTLLDLTDVYMTLYLPTDVAGRLQYGAEARIVFDAAPEYVIPAGVTFVSSEAQFTPKYVETASEREKLMFRVKVTIPPEILADYVEVIKAGVPGVAYVKVDPAAAWPSELDVRLPDVD